MQFPRSLVRHFIAAVITLIFCYPLIVSCSDSPARLTDSQVLATADAIRAQTPTPNSIKRSESVVLIAPTDPPSAELKVIEQENQVAETPTLATDPSALQWNEAASHAGESVTICGPVAGTRYATTTKGAPTFINLGVDYPNAQRFTIVIWGRDRASFGFLPEAHYLGQNLCVSGAISVYRGIAEIEASGPGHIQIK